MTLMRKRKKTVVHVTGQSEQTLGGGSGFVGRQLFKALEENGYDVIVISRNEGKGRITWNDIKNTGLPKDTKIVINLSGENIMNLSKKFDAAFLEEMRSSRVDTTQLLASAISSASPSDRPSVWVVASGIGYYLPTEEVYNEESVVPRVSEGVEKDLQSIFIDWEEFGKLSPEANTTCRHIIIRFGMVLGRSGGAVQMLYKPFSLGFGGRIGDGKQPYPWIHVNDAVGIVMHAIKSGNVKGVLNAVSPAINTNAEFTNAFAAALHRPACFPLPAFVCRAAFGKERAMLMLKGPKVYPKRVLNYGYEYIHPDLESACEALVKDKSA